MVFPCYSLTHLQPLRPRGARQDAGSIGELCQLDDAALADIGLSREQVTALNQVPSSWGEPVNLVTPLLALRPAPVLTGGQFKGAMW